MNIFTRLNLRQPYTATNVATVVLWHCVASIEEAVQPALRNTPFVVVDPRDAKGRIVDANTLARSHGIRPGEFVQRARRRYPHLAIRNYVPERVTGFTNAFQKLARRWGQVVHSAPDGHTVTLAIPATTTLERAAIFLHVQEACWKELECNVIVGVGPNAAYASLAAASCAEPGYQYLDAHESATLRSLPVAYIPGIGRRTAHALVQLNVPMVWDFLHLEPGEVLQLGGTSLLRLYQRYVPVSQPLPLTTPVTLPNVAAASAVA